MDRSSARRTPARPGASRRSRSTTCTRSRAADDRALIAPAGLFRGWFVVAGAFIVLFVAYGVQYSFGVFLAALLEEFRWSRASLAGVFSVYAFVYPLVGSLAGQLTDRLGPRLVISAGGVILGAAMIAMAFVTELWQPYLVYGLVAGVGMSAAYVPCNATVVRWFIRRRGLAVGIAMCGASAGTFVMPLVAQQLVTTVGWRGAYVTFGVMIAGTLLLVAPLVRRDPESLGLRPDGLPHAPRAAVAEGVAWRLADAMRHRIFWMLAVTLALTWVPVFVPLVHLVPFARDLGHAPMTAAWVVSALGAGAVMGRLCMGPLSDRIGRVPAMRVALILQGCACLSFLAAHTLAALLGAAVLYGFGYAAVSTLFPPLVTDLFGRAHAGTIVGVLFAMAGSLSGFGPWLAGALHDATGGYAATWALCAGLNVLALTCLIMVRTATVTSGERPGSGDAVEMNRAAAREGGGPVNRRTPR